MTEPTFPLTFTGPWNEWQHVTPDGAVARIRQVRTGGYIGESAWTDEGPYIPKQIHYTVSIDGRRVDSFCTFEAALRKAKALVLAMYPTVEPAEMPDAPWHQIHG